MNFGIISTPKRGGQALLSSNLPIYLQDHFKRGMGRPNQRKREKSRRYWEKQREREMDRQERGDREADRRGEPSVCRFYKDGKCQKVKCLRTPLS